MNYYKATRPDGTDFQTGTTTTGRWFRETYGARGYITADDLKNKVRQLAHLTPEDWQERRGADPIARTINAVFDIIDEYSAVQPAPSEGLREDVLRATLRVEMGWSEFEIDQFINEDMPREAAALARQKVAETVAPPCDCPGREYGGHMPECHLREARPFA